MKIRLDFVTNSSSSSYLLARKGNGELSKAGREKLADLLIKRFLGDMETYEGLTAENIESHEDFPYDDGEVFDAAKSALKDGFEVVQGYIESDNAENMLTSLLEDVFAVLREEANYRVLDDELGY